MLSLFTYALLLSSSLSSHLTFAQTTTTQSYTTPISVSGAAFARTSTKLYIAGGNNTKPTPQFISLDLSVAWNSSRPAWQILANGPAQALFPAVFSEDESTMIAFHCGTPFAMRYNVAKNTWNASSATAVNGVFQGIGAVTDPLSGSVYLAGGYTGNRDTMSIYSFSSDSFLPNSELLPTSGMFQSRAYYSNVYSKQRQSILYFGGYNSSLLPLVQNNVITEYVPASDSWQTLVTTGIPPEMRSDHCMATNDNGTLVVIYGGRRSGAGFVNDIYILDTISQTWRTGTSGLVRAYAVCVIAGNQLLVWGGVDMYSNNVDSDVQIYNIDSDTWISTYTPPKSYFNSGNNPIMGPNTPSPSVPAASSNVGAIVGGVVGGLAAVIAAALLFVFFRRKRGNQYTKSLVNSEPEDDQYQKASTTQKSRGGQEEEMKNLRAHIMSQQEELEMQRRLLIRQQERNQEYQRQLNQQELKHQHALQPPKTEIIQLVNNYQPSKTEVLQPIILSQAPVIFEAGPSTSIGNYNDSIKVPVPTPQGYYHPPPPLVSQPNSISSQFYPATSSPASSHAMLTVATGSDSSPF
ncbi:hypothetical protein BGZ49_010448 [Haplosporangium sp. Z 27]|nr:hypothetical protein BGZ49_010448 [Haplosporangium sp. Z 27]